MSGHSKWHSIKHKKGAADAKRGKVFTKHAKLITIAARGGGDPDMNPALRTAILNAKADNVPNANIDKAVKKGSGADKDAAVLMEALYEGMGPEGTAFLVEAITDNKNRSVANIKTIFTKNGGSLGSSGSAAWMFEHKGEILVKVDGKDMDELQLMVIDAGADDLEVDGEVLKVYTGAGELMAVKESLENSGLEVEKAGLTYVPKNAVLLDDIAKARKVLEFVAKVEEDDDVSEVYSNFEVSEEVLEEL